MSSETKDPEVLPPGAAVPGRAPAPGETHEQGFGVQRAGRSDVAVETQAAKARALVQARFIMAMERPRKWDDVRTKLLKECERFRFAEEATYEVENRGSGLSIRFAESAVRLMGNASVEAVTLMDSENERTIRITAIDLETNADFSQEVTVEKSVERYSDAGRLVLRKRVTSKGKTIFIVRATAEEVLGLVNREIARVSRGLVLKLIPADIKEDCWDAIQKTVQAGVKADPDAERKRVLDGFAKLNIMPSEIEGFLGHDVAGCTPAEIVELKRLWLGVRDGEVDFRAAVEARKAARAGTPAAEPKSRTDAMAAAVGASGKAPAGAASTPAGGGREPGQD